MSEAVLAGAPATNTGLPWYKNKKLDQYLCFWSVPFFYSVFGLVFVPLSWMMPPRSPDSALADVVGFMQNPNLLIASSILVAVLGLSAVANACYVVQIRRMDVSPAFTLGFTASAMVGAIVGCLFPMFCFGLGAFRPGYDPQIMHLLYDFGYLSFIGSLGCFCVMWGLFGLAIILDTRNILPKWLGYYLVWQFATEIFAATVWIVKTGPFAWDGLLAFWFNMIIYVPWQFIVYVCVFRAIRSQPEHELANVRYQRAGNQV